MWSILYTTPTSLVVAVAPRTGKIIKNGQKWGDNLLQNGILRFVFRCFTCHLS